MAASFKDKVVIVTGGNSGIGASTVGLFLEQGAKVVSLDIVDSQLPPSESRFDVKCDVSSEESVVDAVKTIVDKWETIDVLVNAAGVMDGFESVGDVSTALWNKCINVNLNGPFYLMRAIIPHMLAKPEATSSDGSKGAIVNVCSTASFRGAASGVAYATSKHALLGLTRNTAWMYAKKGIRCNAVVPGGVQTNIIANSQVSFNEAGYQTVGAFLATMPGITQPEEVAKTILFLAGAESVNGAEVSVDKGWLAA